MQLRINSTIKFSNSNTYRANGVNQATSDLISTHVCVYIKWSRKLLAQTLVNDIFQL